MVVATGTDTGVVVDADVVVVAAREEEVVVLMVGAAVTDFPLLPFLDILAVMSDLAELLLFLLGAVVVEDVVVVVVLILALGFDAPMLVNTAAVCLPRLSAALFSRSLPTISVSRTSLMVDRMAASSSETGAPKAAIILAPLWVVVVVWVAAFLLLLFIICFGALPLLWDVVVMLDVVGFFSSMRLVVVSISLQEDERDDDDDGDGDREVVAVTPFTSFSAAEWRFLLLLLLSIRGFAFFRRVSLAFRCSIRR